MRFPTMCYVRPAYACMSGQNTVHTPDEVLLIVMQPGLFIF